MHLIPAGRMEVQATNVIQMSMGYQYSLLENCALGASPDIKSHLAPRYDDACFLRSDKTICMLEPGCVGSDGIDASYLSSYGHPLNVISAKRSFQ
jgi:hypothetical protein